MIGRLAGRVAYIADDHVLIDVGGVGYLVYCSDRTLRGLPRPGEAAALHTDLLVRQDVLQLFGFASLVEKEWHRLLTGVQGIGARASLAILGALGDDGVGRAIALGDWNALTAARGVGAKTAQRVVNELRDKAPAVMALGQAAPAAAAAATAPAGGADTAPRPAAAPEAAATGPGPQAEALSALTNLGYAPGEAAGAVAQAAGEEAQADTPALIRAALRLLAPKG